MTKAKKLYSTPGEIVLLYVREGEEVGHVWDTMHEITGALHIIREHLLGAAINAL